MNFEMLQILHECGRQGNGRKLEARGITLQTNVYRHIKCEKKLSSELTGWWSGLCGLAQPRLDDSMDSFVMQDGPDGAFVTVAEHKPISQPTCCDFGLLCTTAQVSRPAGVGRKGVDSKFWETRRRRKNQFFFDFIPVIIILVVLFDCFPPQFPAPLIDFPLSLTVNVHINSFVAEVLAFPSHKYVSRAKIRSKHAQLLTLFIIQ